MNLGNNPMVFGVPDVSGGSAEVAASAPTAEQLPAHRSARNYLPSHKMVKETLLRCLPLRLTHGEGRAAVASRFDDAMGLGRGREITTERQLCGTPLSCNRCFAYLTGFTLGFGMEGFYCQQCCEGPSTLHCRGTTMS